MNVSHIAATNFRGRNFAHKLAQVTLIIGQNFVGKTSVIDALRLSLAGYLPRVGKTAPLIWDNIAGDPDSEGVVTVQADFSAGRTSRLSFSKNKKGAVSTEGAVPVDLALDPMLLDARQFFRMTQADRIAAIFAASGAPDLSLKSVVEALGKIEATPVVRRDTVLRSIIAGIEAAWEKGASVQATCDKLIAEWKDAEKTAKLNNKRDTGAFNGMKLPIQLPQPATRMAELTARRDAIIQARGQLATLLRAETADATAKVRLEALPGLIAKAREALASIEVPGDEPTQPTRLMEFEATRPKIEQLQEELDELERKFEHEESALESMQGITICPCCGQEGSMDKAREAAKRTLEATEAAIVKITGELAELNAAFADVREIAASFDMQVREWCELTEARVKAEAEVKTLEAELAAKQAAENSSQSSRKEAIEKLNAEVAELPKVEAELAAEDAKGKAFTEYTRLVTERDRLERSVLESQCDADVYKAAVAVMNEQIAKASEVAFSKVLRLSWSFTQGLINSPLEFRDGQLGRRVAAGDSGKPGAWIPFESFSGTEELLALCGFSVALAQMAPFKLVILDELGRLTDERQKAVAERCMELVKDGVVDQIIMVDAVESATKAKKLFPKGLTILDLNA